MRTSGSRVGEINKKKEIDTVISKARSLLVFVLVFVGGGGGGGGPENPEQNPRSKDENQQRTQPRRRIRESNPGHIGGRRARSPLFEKSKFHRLQIRRLKSLY